MKTYALSATLTLACTPPSNTYLLPTDHGPIAPGARRGRMERTADGKDILVIEVKPSF